MDRRQFLFGSIATASALAVGVSLWPNPGTDEQFNDRKLWLIQALVPAVLFGAQPQAKLEQLAPQISSDVTAMLQTLPPGVQQQVNELFSLLDSRLGALALTGSILPMLERSPQQLFDTLNEWRYHYLELVKQAYSALREPIIAAYWSNESNWAQIDYRAPSLGVAS